MKSVFISWKDRVAVIEEVAGSTGCTCFESVTQEAMDLLYKQHGKFGKNYHAVDIDLEEIPHSELKKLKCFVESDD